MAYNEKLADRIREVLVDTPAVEEKYMFGGICFMVNGKMCVGVVKEEIMCRIDPTREQEVLDKPGCRPMDFTGKRMKGYVYVNDEGMKDKKMLRYWVQLCLDFNERAKAAPRKSKKKING